MSDESKRTPARRGALARLAKLVKDQIIAEVPEDTGLCEFDCRKLECSVLEWATCERRSRKAAGELMPLPR